MAERRSRKPSAGKPAPTHPRMAGERLRNEIDAGRTGDKIPASDPAAAPLGTDDEAAGRPAAGNVEPFPGTRREPPPSAPPGHAKGRELGPGRGVPIAIASAMAAALVLLLLLLL